MKGYHKISKGFLLVIFKILSSLLTVFKNDRKLLRLKIAVGTLIISSYANTQAQETTSNTTEVYLENNTLHLDVDLEEDNVDLMCYIVVLSNYRYTVNDDNRKLGFMTLDDYIETNLRYPQRAIDRNIEGKVLVQLTLDESCKITDIGVLRGIGHGCDEEAIRLVESWVELYLHGEELEAKSNEVVEIEFKLPEVEY